MALLLTEDQQMLKDAACGLLAEKAPVGELRRLRDEKDPTGFSRELWREMAAMGWAGMVIPEQYGGLDFGYAGLGQVLEEMGRNLSVTPLQSTVLVSATTIIEAGSERQCAEWLPKIAAGELIASLALEEGRHHGPENTALQARAVDQAYVLDGKKMMVLDGHVADLLLVVARTSAGVGERDGLTLFAVPADSAGIEIEPQSMVDSRNASVVTLSNVAVTPQQIVGGLGEAHGVLERSLAIANIGLSAELLGVGLEAFDRTIAYLVERQQFGVPIGSFQGLQHRAADLYCELELCKSLVLKSLQCIDEGGEELLVLASMTKAKTALVGKRACCEAIQMFGGIGMTDEIDIGFFLKRAQALINTFGDANYHLDRYGRLSGY